MKPNIQHTKSKFPLLRLLLIALFTILLFTFCSNHTTLTVHANSNPSGGGNAGQDGSNQGSQIVIEGPKSTKQFWLCYLTTESGGIESDIVLIAYSDDIKNANKQYLSTRPEHTELDGTAGHPDRIKYTSTPSWGWAYTETGEVRGNEIKAWMTSTNSDGDPNAVVVVEDLWGTKMAENFIDKNLYLVLEDGMWAGFYEDGEYSGKILAATAYGWALHNFWTDAAENKYESNGDVKISLYSNDKLPNAIKLEFDQTGLKAPTTGGGKKTNEEIRDYGYGVGIFWVEKPATHTWDSDNHPTDEAKAPEPPVLTDDSGKSQLKYTIIKSYRIKDKLGNYEDKGTYTRINTAPDITIEDEPLGPNKNYKVIGWKQSSTTKSNISSLTWDVPPAISNIGDSSGHTTLTSYYPVLYVLLEAEKDAEAEPEDDVGFNFLLPQSSITRLIDYSTPDYHLSNMTTKLNTIQFNYLSSAHSTTCLGHTWDEEVEDGGHWDLATGNWVEDTKTVTHEYKCINFAWVDNKLEAGLKNLNAASNPEILASKWSFEIPVGNSSPVETNKVYARSSMGTYAFLEKYNAYGVLLRGDDDLSLADWKNTAASLSDTKVLTNGTASTKVFRTTNFNLLKHII